VAARTYKTEAVVLRSFRLGEADRVLHVYTLERGRIGAVAKGIRRTKSRFGARLEPLSHVEVMLHQGSGELQTITGVELIQSHRPALRLFTEQETNPRAFHALARFLELLDALPVPEERPRPALDPLVLSFQLKLLWLSGYLPHVTSCAACGAEEELIGYSPRAGGAVCRNCGDETTLSLAPEGLRGIEALLRRPLADAAEAGLTARASRDAHRVITSSYEFHGGFRLRTSA